MLAIAWGAVMHAKKQVKSIKNYENTSDFVHFSTSNYDIRQHFRNHVGFAHVLTIFGGFTMTFQNKV